MSNDLAPRINTPTGGGSEVEKEESVASVKKEVIPNYESRDKLVLQSLPLIKIIALGIKASIPVYVELDDLISSGIIGAFEATRMYNPKHQVSFANYAKHRIKGAMLDSLRKFDWASRDMRNWQKKIEKALSDLRIKLEENPSEEEIAKELGWTVERLRSRMIDLETAVPISASTRKDINKKLPRPDFSANPAEQPDNLFAQEELRSVLAEAIKTLPPRYQRVIFLYYTREMTLKEIGKVLWNEETKKQGVNESRVSQMHAYALRKLYTALKEKGINSPVDFKLALHKIPESK